MLDHQLVSRWHCHINVYTKGATCLLMSVGYLNRYATTDYMAADLLKLSHLFINQILDRLCLLDAFEINLDRTLHNSCSLHIHFKHRHPVNDMYLVQSALRGPLCLRLGELRGCHQDPLDCTPQISFELSRSTR